MAGRITAMKGRRGRTYKVRYDGPTDPETGARTQRSRTFKTRREAEDFDLSVRHALRTGTYAHEAKTTVGDVCERYLTATKGAVRPSTHLAREGIVRTHILPVWGARKASTLTPLMVQERMDTLAKARAPRTVRNVHHLLSRIYAQAVRWRLVASNPCAGTILPPSRGVSGREESWDGGEARTFLDKARSDSLFPVYRLALMTGMRRSELLALRWRDIDLANGRALVRSSLVRGVDQRFHLADYAKTPESERAIALDAGTLADLAAMRKSAEDRNRFSGDAIEGTFIFRDGNGGHLNPERVGKRFVRLVADLADDDGNPLPRITLHGLRHTHASLLAESGVGLRTIMERLGHGTPHMTLGRYMHGSVESDRRAAESLSSLLGDAVEDGDGDAALGVEAVER